MISRSTIAAIALLVATSARAQAPAPPPPLPFSTDTVRSQLVRPGVTHWYLYAPSGPWAIHVLQVERDSCYSALAVKSAPGAIGRAKTSELLRDLARTEDVVAGVNADFFLFTPPGVPANAHVSQGRVVVGPSQRPLLAFDSSGAPRIATLRAAGSVRIGGVVHAIRHWNRRGSGLSLFDASWGRETDTASAAIEVALSAREPSRVVRVDTTVDGVALQSDGGVLVASADAPPALRAALLSLEAGDTVRVEMTLTPFWPREAVGGRPVLLRDSVIVDAVDTEGGPGFATGRHPRTAVGIGRGGKRLLFVVVDGRQKPYSDGMTLRELATLMLALGARDAINLDGGGSSTLVYADPDSAGALRTANRPSDAAGERAVGNALAIVRRNACHPERSEGSAASGQ